MARTTRAGNTKGASRNSAAQNRARTRSSGALGSARATANKEAQREEYGGFSFGAAFFGWLSATALAAILTSLVVAGGVSLALTRIEQNVGAVEGLETIGVLGGVLLLAILALAYLAGGYVAGRMSRFDGITQGIGVWIIGIAITLLLALAGIVFGAAYNVNQQLNLPRIPVDEGTMTTGGLMALLAVLAATLLAAIAGGKLGERYHRKVERAGR